MRNEGRGGKFHMKEKQMNNKTQRDPPLHNTTKKEIKGGDTGLI